MDTLKFHKTDCGVDFLLNVLRFEDVKSTYISRELFNTDFFEILFFKKGKGTLILNHQEINITDNSIVFISPFQKRQWKIEPQDSDFTILVFQEDFLNDFFSDKLFTYRLLYFYQLEYSLHINIENETIERYCTLLTEIKTELLKTQADSVHIIRSLIYYILQKLNREYAQIHGLTRDRQADNYAFQFKKLLENHICTKQRVSDYVELLGISRITLNKAVKAHFNTTAVELLKRRLLFEIQNAAMYSGKTISQIADDLHFSEANHLMRFFKNMTGQTISEFTQDK
ncbi:AraC family transcriptional regulator [Chryseobacterium indologenes]|uniref:AraC family transcriptional regulator n=1 Tax=Chryseobacterium indologenes TaxID=253 RepID=UPI0021A8AD63|nr:helix-turn-helix domain-containing protein [Elizabethkingia anophelis]